MKNILLLFMICILFLSANETGSGGFVLSQANADHYDTVCKAMVNNYYRDMKSLAGSNVKNDTTATGDVAHTLERDIATQYFLDSSIVIYNDISPDNKNSNNKDYLVEFNTLYCRDNHTLDIIAGGDNIKFSNIYYDAKLDRQRYYLVATVDRSIIYTPENPDSAAIVNKKAVDIYFCWNSGSSPKIFNISKHNDDSLKALQKLVNVTADEVVDKTIKPDVPYLTFDVSPADATIELDQSVIYYTGDRWPTVQGIHHVKISSHNYAPQEFDISTPSSGVLPVIVSLESNRGYLAVNSDDESIIGSDVWIDGENAGTVPFHDYPLNVGSHHVNIKHNNIFGKSYNIAITDENVTMLNIKGNSNSWWHGTQVQFYSYNNDLYVGYPPPVAYPANYWQQSVIPVAEYPRWRHSTVRARQIAQARQQQYLRKNGYRSNTLEVRQAAIKNKMPLQSTRSAPLKQEPTPEHQKSKHERKKERKLEKKKEKRERKEAKHRQKEQKRIKSKDVKGPSKKQQKKEAKKRIKQNNKTNSKRKKVSKPKHIKGNHGGGKKSFLKNIKKVSQNAKKASKASGGGKQPVKNKK